MIFKKPLIGLALLGCLSPSAYSTDLEMEELNILRRMQGLVPSPSLNASLVHSLADISNTIGDQQVIIEMDQSDVSIGGILKQIEDIHLEDFKTKTMPTIIQEVRQSSIGNPDINKRIQIRILREELSILGTITQEERQVIEILSRRNSISKDIRDTWITKIELSHQKTAQNITYKLEGFNPKHAPSSLANKSYAAALDKFSEDHKDIIPVPVQDKSEAASDDFVPYIIPIDHNFSSSELLTHPITVNKKVAACMKQHKAIVQICAAATCTVLASAGSYIGYMLYKHITD